jgi:hypothetical protein
MKMAPLCHEPGSGRVTGHTISKRYKDRGTAAPP